MDNKMNYKIIMTTGSMSTVLAEFATIEWAEEFVQSVKDWLKKSGDDKITKIRIENK